MNEELMNQWLPVVVSAAASVIASGGFWAWLQRKGAAKSAMARLLMGLAYDKIQTLGMNYMARGWISVAEYEDFRKYLYEPYRDFGGNGVAEQVMHQVSNLPMRSAHELAYSTIVEAQRSHSNASE
jgi:hypothetical protein